ncbi:MAG: hypothetical protein ACLFQR_13230 [Desulfovibrionales bacterium]
MEPTSWHVTIVTPGKMYKGIIHAGTALDRRTVSLLNSTNKTTKYTDETLTLDGFVQLDDVMLSVGKRKKGFSSISVRKSEIIFALDEFASMGSESERKRFQSWSSPEDRTQVSIITKLRAGQSFQLTGRVFSLKQKFAGKDRFMAMTDVQIEKLNPRPDASPSKPSQVPFAAVNKEYIEAISLVEVKFVD